MSEPASPSPSGVVVFFFREVAEMRETLALAGLCLLIAVVSLGVMLWAVVDAFLDHLPSEVFNVDSLLLIAICLFMSTVFGFCAAWIARDAGLWPVVRNRRPASSDPKNPPPKP